MSAARFSIAALLTLGVASGAFADEPKVPEGATPLTEAEIKELLDGKTYEFVAYDEPLTGTSTWNYDKQTVSGSYVWKKKDKGEYESKWFLQDGKNCTQSPKKDAVCQIIYTYKEGFMEVTPKGVVHAISKLKD